MTENRSSQVIVVGGGMAALEAVLALRALAGDRIEMTMIAPDTDFVLRPMLVAEPLGAGSGLRRPLQEIADDVGFRLLPGVAAGVDAARRHVTLRNGAAVPYGTLILAPGAKRVPVVEDAIQIGGDDAPRALAELRTQIRRGAVGSVGFVAPTTTGWLLPLYEAALLTAAIDDRVLVSLITAEEQPLALFGPEASAAVADALLVAGVEFAGGGHASTIAAERLVALPLVAGPRIAGVPVQGLTGLIPTDHYGRVDGLPDAYAVGDATAYPVKQGGLACQQADVAARHIAAAHGAPLIPQPFNPVLRASLITGEGTSIQLGDRHAPAGKVPGRHLAAYLSGWESDVPAIRGQESPSLF
jgi:sulfide:quinone oxidoreductase